ncbi:MULTISPECIES: hypothetical protein [Trichococcus]|uniref:Uncharacterized protein n=1 Tax=Trichococcus shcherbakoviae TaxID=2094020 RepID=A0A383TE78_9LACT|nr:hypothetical protein [Trichococcus shcherbakoviae]SYZ78236.1 Hypothetical protein TART1_1019 [Trichococcus shcherbakoviae]
MNAIVTSVLGLLVERLGITYSVAAAIIFVLENGGVYAAAALYPFAAPVLFTVKGFMATVTTAFLVGF